ncbi:MAG: trypsin-like peptidase domain-containing protein [Dethiobacteraceae bacterium]
MKNRVKMYFLIVILLAFSLGLAASGWILYFNNLSATAVTADQASAPISTVNFSQPNSLPGLGPNTIADLVEKVGPAVVSIETFVETRRRQQDPFQNDPFFRQFFGETPFSPGNQVRRGMGSGFIISQDGYVLTNQHVVQGATRIEVRMPGREDVHEAKLIGSDFELDLAVLKIDADNLPALTLGNTDEVRVGEWVVAIGNPYGMAHTVTVGVISYKGRRVTVEDRRFEDLLQTDASINPGNSGGPLLNLKGEVIGINTAMKTQAQGIGFSISANTVRMVLRDLIEKGKVIRPWMGVLLQDVTPQLAQQFNLNASKGVLIADVVQGGPAHRAGLRRGDIVLEIDGRKIDNSEQFIKAIRATPIGNQIALLIHRQNTTRHVTVSVEERPQTPQR